MEEYYLAKKVKDTYMIEAFNMNVIRHSGENLELLSSKVIRPDQIGIVLKNGEITCIDDKYELKKINKKRALETLEKMTENYSLWQSYMSNSDDKASPHLGKGGDFLY